MKKLTIGLFGFGVVGEGVYQLLQVKPELNAVIKKVCVQDSSKTRNAPQALFTDKAEELLHDAEINVIIELIDDAEMALSITKKAMKTGKSVISANKKMIAENLEELIFLQQQNCGSMLYEAAVCGSIPIIRNLEEYYQNDLIRQVSGIFNGSTNYILSKMKSDGMSYSEALDEAQKNGFAESDPSLDVSGMDAAYKLSIVALHAFGELIDPKQMTRTGIQNLSPIDFRLASSNNQTIKLIAEMKRNDKSFTISVMPRFLEETSRLAKVHNEYNGVQLDTSLADEQFFYGKGAGKLPTTLAVLSDISSLASGYQYHYKKYFRKQPTSKTIQRLSSA